MKKETLLKKVADAASTGIMSTDETGTLVFCNEQASAILRCDVSASLGEHISVSYPKLARPVNQCLATAGPQLGKHIRTGGQYFQPA